MKSRCASPKGAEFKTPFDVLAEREEMAVRTEEQAVRLDAQAIAEEAVMDWLAWLYEDGPGITRAAKRLKSLAREYRPDLQDGLSAEEMVLIFSKGEAADAQAAVAAAKRRNPHLCMGGELTSFDEMKRREKTRYGALEAVERERGIMAFVASMYAEGPAILTAAKRLYSLVRAVRPDLQRCMSGEELASLFGQGRGGESARTLRVTTEVLAAGGCKFTALPYQKSAEAKRKYAAAQRGNQNRRRKAA